MITTAKNPKKNILAVDDSNIIRIMEKNILEKAGYEVTLASDGQRGWDALARKNFDLVVSDISMPNMDGFEFTYKIKHSERYKCIPVILLSSLESEEDKMRGLEVGADAYILKSSFDKIDLLDIIKRLI